MAEVYDIKDLYALQAQATQEGLSIGKYLAKLRSYGIPLDIALENAGSGISLEGHLLRRETMRGLKRVEDLMSGKLLK
jgi:hypothetical protein